MKVPQGVEKIVALATLSPEWRAKVLADPLAAAAEAGIELGAAEREILRSVSARMLAGMVDSFGKSVPRPAGLGKLAAGAAAALLAASLLGCGDGDEPSPPKPKGIRPDQPPPNPRKEEPGQPVSYGIQPDAPPPKSPSPSPNMAPEGSEAPAALRMNSLDDALAEAKKENRAVMAVFSHPAPVPALSSPERRKSTIEWKSTAVLSRCTRSKEFRATVEKAGLMAAKVDRPTHSTQVSPPLPDDDETRERENKAIKRLEGQLKGYQEVLKKCGVEEKLLPAVVFLAPDGMVLAKLLQPQEEVQLTEAIKAVPPLMAKWVQDRRVSEGTVRTAGVRPDIPPEKGK